MRYAPAIALGLLVLVLIALGIPLVLNQRHLSEMQTELARTSDQMLGTELYLVMKAGDPKNRDTGWFNQFIHFVMMESAEKRVGAEGVLARLSELMFIEVVRRYVEALPPGQTGWLAGLRDPCVGKALSLLHGEPAKTWTLEQLAKHVGFSRSLLTERFTDLVGIPPMQYLAKWRMQIAAELLIHIRESLSRLYDSTVDSRFDSGIKGGAGNP